MEIKVLYQWEGRGHEGREVSKEEWAKFFKPYGHKIASHCSNLAAHTWDILTIDGRLFCGYPLYYDNKWGRKGHFIDLPESPVGFEHGQDFTREEASDELLMEIYPAVNVRGF
jgi:hypothetical protein